MLGRSCAYGLPDGHAATRGRLGFGTLGPARGIAAKLRTLREAREATLRGSSGRDLVVAKAGVVDAELDKLGLRFRARKGTAGRRVLAHAFEQGHEAGLGFEYTPGVGHDG